MQHYYHPMSRAVTTDWMLRELEAEHEQVFVDFMKGENRTPEFMAINPMGKLPTLVDDGVVVTEAAAICLYLADKFSDRGLAPPAGSPERGRYYRYVLFAGNTLEPMFTMSQQEGVEFNPVSVGWGDRERCLNAMNEMTPAAGWILGDRFSAADVVFGGMLSFACQFGWIPDPAPQVTGYVERIRSRPAYQQANSAG
jgi:glutathione S-transferase